MLGRVASSHPFITNNLIALLSFVVTFVLDAQKKETFHCDDNLLTAAPAPDLITHTKFSFILII